MVLMRFGKRTGTDRYVNGPYRFTLTHNGLLAAVLGIGLTGLVVWAVV